MSHKYVIMIAGVLGLRGVFLWIVQPILQIVWLGFLFLFAGYLLKKTVENGKTQKMESEGRKDESQRVYPHELDPDYESEFNQNGSAHH